MPKYSSKNDASIKFELPKDLKKKFYAMCKNLNWSGADYMREVIIVSLEEMKQEKKGSK